MYNECRHIMPSGIRCHAPALRETHFCYFHTNLHRVTAPKTKFDDWSLKLPVLEDRRAIQMALTQVLGELAAGRLDPRRAGLLLYGLQIATKVAARTSMVFLNPVRSLSYEGEDVLAPEKTVCEPPQDCRNCPKSETCDNFMEMEEDDEDEDEEQLPGSVAAVLDKLAGCEEDHGAPHHGQDHSVEPQLAQACTAQDADALQIRESCSRGDRGEIEATNSLRPESPALLQNGFGLQSGVGLRSHAHQPRNRNQRKRKHENRSGNKLHAPMPQVLKQQLRGNKRQHGVGDSPHLQPAPARAAESEGNRDCAQRQGADESNMMHPEIREGCGHAEKPLHNQRRQCECGQQCRNEMENLLLPFLSRPLLAGCIKNDRADCCRNEDQARSLRC